MEAAWMKMQKKNVWKTTEKKREILKDVYLSEQK